MTTPIFYGKYLNNPSIITSPSDFTNQVADQYAFISVTGLVWSDTGDRVILSMNYDDHPVGDFFYSRLEEYTCGAGDEYQIHLAVNANIHKGFGNHLTLVNFGMNKGGTILYATIDGSQSVMRQYNLGVPFKISSIGSTAVGDEAASFNVNTVFGFTRGYYPRVSEGGDKFYVVERSGAGAGVNIHQASLSTPFNINSISNDSVSFAFAQANNIKGIEFKFDGTKVFVQEQNSSGADNLFQYSLSTPWDISTITYDGSITAATSDIITLVDHGYVQGEGPVQFETTGTLPAGLTASTDYFIIKIDSDTFKVATSLASATIGITVDITDTGTGIHSIIPTKYAVGLEDISSMKLAGNMNFATNGKSFYVSDETNRKLLQYDLFSCELITKDDSRFATVPRPAGLGHVGEIASKFSGLEHLEGEEVSVLSDGSVSTETIVGGLLSVTKGSKVHIGLPYTTDIETLNIQPPEGGTIQGKRTKFSEVMVRFYKSRLPFIGQDEDSLVEMKQREDEKYGEATKLLSGDKHTYLFPQWTTDGRIFIRQAAPVPLTILAIVPDVEVED